MSPIDVEMSTIGFPFSAAGAITATPIASVIVARSVARRDDIVVPPLPLWSGPLSTRWRGPQASVHAMPMLGRGGQDDRRHCTREVAPDLDAAAVVHAGDEAPPADVRVRH